MIAALFGAMGIIRGPFRVTGAVDRLNGALRALLEQRRASGAGGGLGSGAMEEGCGGGSAEDEASPTVFRPSRVQWLTSYDETEMPKLIGQIKQASADREHPPQDQNPP